MFPSRRRFLVAAACLPASSWAARDETATRREDFDAMWRAIDARYAYFGDRRNEWHHARETWRRKAMAARSLESHIAALEGALATLHDDHVTLSVRTPRSPRLVPLETDLWGRWKDGAATIESVRFAGDADVAGVHPGDVVTHIDGVAVRDAIASRLANGRGASAIDRDWALRHALAGPRDGILRLDLGGKEPRHAQLERSDREPAPNPSVQVRRIGEKRDIAYVRLRNLADERAAEQFDSAATILGESRALVIDLRESTPGPRASTLALLSRLAVRESPWQIREGHDRKRDADRIVPASRPAFRGPLIVLVDRWTCGESEALAAGLAAVASARLIGTPMAGLRGEIHHARLPHSGVVVRFPGEKTFLPDGTPRESLRPAVEVDPAAPNGGPGDPILYQGLKVLEK